MSWGCLAVACALWGGVQVITIAACMTHHVQVRQLHSRLGVSVL
jgi:hypothetical protein